MKIPDLLTEEIEFIFQDEKLNDKLKVKGVVDRIIADRRGNSRNLMRGEEYVFTGLSKDLLKVKDGDLCMIRLSTYRVLAVVSDSFGMTKITFEREPV